MKSTTNPPYPPQETGRIYENNRNIFLKEVAVHEHGLHNIKNLSLGIAHTLRRINNWGAARNANRSLACARA